MAGRLTTHVLDTVHGRPAAGLSIELYRIDRESDTRERLLVVRTNAEGRTDGPLLAGDALRAGIYELVFSLGDYFAAVGRANAPDPVPGQGTGPLWRLRPGRQLPYPAPSLSLGLLHLPWQLARRFSRGYSTLARGRNASWPAAMNWPPSPRNQGGVTRPYGTPALAAARERVAQWMREAGLSIRIDAVGNRPRQSRGSMPTAPALLLGSHLDSVRDAGRYDGPLGILVAIEAVDQLRGTTTGPALPG